MVKPEVLEGNGVLLRAWRAEDAPAVDAIRSDPIVSRWSSLQREDAATWIARQSHRLDGVSLAVTLPPGNAALGKVALGHHDPTTRQAELSYWLLPAARGRRIAIAASRALCDWAFSSLGLQRIVLDIETDNEPSKAVARTLGALPDSGLTRTEVDRQGTQRQLVRWAVTPG